MVGNGGRTLWERFVADVARDPRLLVGEAHPLDCYVARILADVDPEPGPGRRWVRCAADDGADVDFRTLAVEAGLGWGSPLGLVLHPRFGPWMGLRAACFTTEQWTPTRLGASPCASCSRPCVSACPAGAVGTRFDIARCASAHAVPGPCAVICHSRQACPVGTDHQYSDLQLHYHSDRRTGRIRLAAALAVTDDVHPASVRSGTGPSHHPRPEEPVARKPSLAPKLYTDANTRIDRLFMDTMIQQDRTPVRTNAALPRFTLVVGPSPFTMPRGWEFFLTSPYEGATYISTVLHNAGYPVRIVDVRYSPDPLQDAYDQIVDSTDVLGICTFEDNFPWCRELMAAIRRDTPEDPIVCGGSLVTSVPQL